MKYDIGEIGPRVKRYFKRYFKIHFRINGKPFRTQNTNNLTVETRQTINFGRNSISSLGPKIWNSLPYQLK